MADRAQREMALIREYRTRLIADVVTGKLDVRAVAIAIPARPEPDAEDAEGAWDGDGATADDQAHDLDEISTEVE